MNALIRYVKLFFVVVSTLITVGCHTSVPTDTNEPPFAFFTVSPETGTIGTMFHVDASGCTDDHDATADLRVRWDWEDDGVWNTVWTTVKTDTHLFDATGIATIRLQVKDQDGMISSTTRRPVQPSDTQGNYLLPDRIENVVANLAEAIRHLNVNRYLECLADTFVFIPDVLDSVHEQS
jgi:hypothetical protein